MSYCKSCTELKEEPHETPYGTWSHTCKKLNIGREPWTWACDKITPKEEKMDDEKESSL